MSFVAIAVGFGATAGTAAAIGAGVATTVAVAGTVMAVNAKRNAADVAEAEGEYKAQTARNQAKTDTLIAEENARRQARMNAQFMAKQRADLAARGLTLEGTPLAILGETATTLERDISDIAFGASQAHKASVFSADMDELEGRNTAAGYRAQSNATLVTGIGNAATGYGKAAGYLA